VESKKLRIRPVVDNVKWMTHTSYFPFVPVDKDQGKQSEMNCLFDDYSMKTLLTDNNSNETHNL